MGGGVPKLSVPSSSELLAQLGLYFTILIASNIVEPFREGVLYTKAVINNHGVYQVYL